MLQGLRKLIGISFLLCVFTSANAAEIYDEALDGGGVIFIDGEISQGDVDAFRAISVRYSKAIVVLDSDGGLLLPAIEIGKVIQIAGYTTLVPEDAICASSCALIWLAGERRFLSPEGSVGFHASYRDNSGRIGESGVANALIGNYLARLNLSERAIIFATTAPPNDILWLTKANKAHAGIDFEDFVFDEEVSQSAGTADISTQREAAAVRVSPPIVASPPARATTLPSSLPASLSNGRSEWIRYAGNAFYDLRSIQIVEDIRGRPAGRKFWIVIDHSADRNSKYTHSLAQYFVYCPNETVSVYHWADYQKRDGRAKVRETSSRPVPAPPGSAHRNLVDEVCH